MIRAFVALSIPEVIKIRIRDIQERLKTYHLPVRWVRAENIHLTLQFFGDIPAGDVDRIAKVMNETAGTFSSLNLYAKGIGVFPGIKKPRVLWLGISGDIKSLIEIQSSLVTNLETQGFSGEKRPFKSHLTIGRFKGHINTEHLCDVLRSFSDFMSEPFETNEIVLYQSILKPSGAQYAQLKTAFLDGSQK